MEHLVVPTFITPNDLSSLKVRSTLFGEGQLVFMIDQID